MSKSATDAALASELTLHVPETKMYIQGYMELEAINPSTTPKPQTRIAVVMKGRSAQLALDLPYCPLIDGRLRLSYSEAEEFKKLIVEAVMRDDRFRQHRVVGYSMVFGQPISCTEPRLQTIVEKMASGELNRAERLAEGRGAIDVVMGIQAKKENAVRHMGKCSYCNFTLMVGPIPTWHLRYPIWQFLKPFERRTIQTIVNGALDYNIIMPGMPATA